MLMLLLFLRETTPGNRRMDHCISDPRQLLSANLINHSVISVWMLWTVGSSLQCHWSVCGYG